MMAEATGYLTVKEAADRLRLTQDTVRRWLRTGQLKGTYLSDRAGYRIPESEVERILSGEIPAVKVSETEQEARREGRRGRED